MDDDEIIHKCLLSNPPLYEELYKMLNQARADERAKFLEEHGNHAFETNIKCKICELEQAAWLHGKQKGQADLIEKLKEPLKQHFITEIGCRGYTPHLREVAEEDAEEIIEIIRQTAAQFATEAASPPQAKKSSADDFSVASESLGSGEFKEASPQTKPEKRKKKVSP